MRKKLTKIYKITLNILSEEHGDFPIVSTTNP